MILLEKLDIPLLPKEIEGIGYRLLSDSSEPYEKKKDYSISENKRIREDLMTMPVPPLPDIWQGRQFFCPYPVIVVQYDIRMKNKGGRSENV